jgi:hypothetical protein
MARSVYVSAPPASSVIVPAGQRAQVEVRAERTREVTLGPGASVNTPVRDQSQAGACPGRRGWTVRTAVEVPQHPRVDDVRQVPAADDDDDVAELQSSSTCAVGPAGTSRMLARRERTGAVANRARACQRLPRRARPPG